MDPPRYYLPSFIDQNFGMCISPQDLIYPFYNVHSLNYFRPWKLNTQKTAKDFKSTIHNEKDAFTISLDVHNFKLSELNVKVSDNEVIIEGNHEERKEVHGFISRHFKRRYILPKDCNPDSVVSSLSSDGVLVISANKNINENNKEIIVPIKIYGKYLKHEGIDSTFEALQTVKETKKVDIEESKNIDIEERKKADIEESKKADIKESSKIYVEERQKVDIEKSQKTDNKEGRNIDIEERKEVDFEESKKADIKEGKNIDIKERKTVVIEQSKKAVIKQSEKVDFAQSKTVDIEQSKKMDFAQTKKDDIEQSKKVDIEQSKKIDIIAQTKKGNIEQSKNDNIEQSKKVDAIQIKKVEIEQSNKMDIEQSKKHDIEQDKKVDIAQSKHFDIEQCKNVDIKQSKKVDIGQSKKVDIAQSKRVDVAQSKKDDIETKKKNKHTSREDHSCLLKPELLGVTVTATDLEAEKISNQNKKDVSKTINKNYEKTDPIIEGKIEETLKFDKSKEASNIAMLEMMGNVAEACTSKSGQSNIKGFSSETLEVHQSSSSYSSMSSSIKETTEKINELVSDISAQLKEAAENI